jgi:Tfp pilus assembly protein PilN
MRINLLPWRAQAQRRQTRHFILQTLAVAASALIIGMGFIQWQHAQIAEQQHRNQQLEQGIVQFKQTLTRFEQQDTKRRALQSRLGLVNQLQRQRNNVTAVLNFIPTVMPAGAYLTRLAQQQGHISLEGWVNSNVELARLLAALEAQQAVEALDIDTVVTDDHAVGPNKRFRLSFSLTHYVSPQLPGHEEGEQ